MTKLTRNTRIVLSAVLFFSLVSLACGASAPRVTPTQPTQAAEVIQAIPTANTSQIELVTNEDQVLVDLYSHLDSYVVDISVYLSQNGLLAPYAQGSGFVYDDQGHIITNAHVVHGIDAVQVTFSDGLIRDATIVAEDLFSDLAVIKVEVPSGITPIPVGNMDELAVGQTVVAVGNPFGFEGTLTTGIISALGRSIPSQTRYSIPQAIQTDAAINPGNSGGPLLNLKGQVIGINSAIFSLTGEYSGVGFAIPSSTLQRVVPILVSQHTYKHPWIGISGID